MKKLLVLWVAALLAAGCETPRAEPAVIRLLDLAASAESKWPPGKRRAVPEELSRARRFGKLRKTKVGRVDMFPEGGGDSRLALIAPSGTSHRFQVRPQPDAQLRVGLGYVPSVQDGLQVRFVVTVEDSAEAGLQRLVDETITTASDGDWVDIEADLSPWSGREVELSLRTLGGGSGPLVWGAWSAPEILSETASQGGPDVILISLDTLRADRLGCYGYPVETSPNLDRLAARGVRFERAVSQAPWTAPSHRALFSGFYVTARARKESPTLAEMLHQAGFRTEALTGGGQMDFRMGFSSGFETYRVFDWIRDMRGLERWLSRSSRRRRFLFLHTYEIHDPYIHAELAAGHDGGKVAGYFDKKKWWRLRGKLTAEEKAHVSNLYDGGIAYTDRQLGVLFDLLEESGALERSIIVITSDHGEQFWEHGTWRHGMNLYDHQIMVPLIVHLPESLKSSLASAGDLTGRVFERQVRLIDLFPTILDLVGVPLSHALDGRSLTPLLRGRDLPSVDAFSERLNVDHRESKALRTERFKFIYSFPKQKGLERGLEETWELYDLVGDPGEQHNLAPGRPETVAELDLRLRTLLSILSETSDVDEGTGELDPDLEERLRALGYLGE